MLRHILTLTLITQPHPQRHILILSKSTFRSLSVHCQYIRVPIIHGFPQKPRLSYMVSGVGPCLAVTWCKHAARARPKINTMHGKVAQSQIPDDIQYRVICANLRHPPDYNVPAIRQNSNCIE